MLSLNITPPELKKEIKLKLILKKIKNLFFVLLILFSFYSIFLLGLKLILQIHFVNTVAETSIVTKNTENYSREIRNINVQINSIEKIQNNFVVWSKFLTVLSNEKPIDITLNKISLNYDDNSLTLSGFSNTRENLLNLKSNLENCESLMEINFPLSNLLEKNNINFELSAKIKTYEFK